MELKEATEKIFEQRTKLESLLKANGYKIVSVADPFVFNYGESAGLQMSIVVDFIFDNQDTLLVADETIPTTQPQ